MGFTNGKYLFFMESERGGGGGGGERGGDLLRSKSFLRLGKYRRKLERNCVWGERGGNEEETSKARNQIEERGTEGGCLEGEFVVCRNFPESYLILLPPAVAQTSSYFYFFSLFSLLSSKEINSFPSH
jgi:hypothetical protein